jgi:hypothetical protein
MSARHAIPDAALDDRLGFVGMTGSGKTFGAGTCVERILHKGGRVIIPDPLGVWWGLRLLADGKTPSPYNVVIFGGPHADLPITPHAGALIGEAVAGMRESAIIDLSEFETAAAERRFMLAFLDAVYRKATRDPVHIVFDEADLWAPERILDREGNAQHLHGMMQTVVRRGRVKGLTSWLITQRPASLAKSVLSQVSGLVAFQLTASQDRKALGAWIEGQADKDAGKAILDRLPTKTQGEAVVWLPARGILTDVQFPLKETFDSSRAPERGQKKKRTAELSPIDLGALKERLATVEAETKASDPKALKATIAELQKQLRARPAETKAPEQAAATIRALERAAVEAKIAGYADAMQGTHGMMAGIREKIAPLEAALAAIKADVVQIEKWAKRELSKPSVSRAIAIKVPSGSPAPPRPSPPRSAGYVDTAARSTKSSPAANGDDSLSPPLQRIIDAIRWWNVLGVAGPSHSQVAFIAGYSHKSGTWATYLSRLRLMNMIEGRGDLMLTQEGAAAVNEPSAPPSGEQLRATVLGKIDGPLARILTPILEAYPAGLSHAEAAEHARYSAQSGTWATYLSRLRSLDLIDGRGELRAQEWLFP